MSGETESRPSGWTVDTLHTYLENLINERDRQYDDRFHAQEKAVLVALEQTKTRFDNVNEWRGTVQDLISGAMPRRESDARWAATVDRIDALASRMDRIEGKSSGLTAFWGVLIAVLVIVMNGVAIYLSR